MEDIYCQEFYLISLDVFREVGYAKDDNELTAWLSLLATSTYEDAELLCQKYPWMEEIFAEISEYVHNPEEVVGMFSEALKIMDDNMYHYMADQYQAKVERQQAEIENQQAEIENQQAEIENQQAEIENQQVKIENLQTESQKLYQTVIAQLKMIDYTKEAAIQKIAEICKSEDAARDMVEKYW